MREDSCAALPRAIHLILCSAGAGRVIRFSEPLRRATVGTLSDVPSQGRPMSACDPWIGIHSKEEEWRCSESHLPMPRAADVYAFPGCIRY